MAEKYITQSYGILYTREGQEFYLLRPEPITKESWQLDCQQTWLCVPRFGDYDKKFDQVVYRPSGFARHVITTYPTIELVLENIEVETVGLDENGSEVGQILDYIRNNTPVPDFMDTPIMQVVDQAV